MTMRMEPLNNQPQPRKRTLRSTAKCSQTYSKTPSSVEQQKIVQPNNKQIEHQDACTNSKTLQPPLEEAKLHSESKFVKDRVTRSQQKLQSSDINEPKSQDLPVERKQPELAIKSEEISLEAQFKPKESIECRQKINRTPFSRAKLKKKRMSDYSVYGEKRKSYRKPTSQLTISVPFRKCLDQFETRIVALINKIVVQQKCTDRDIEGLKEKIRKISPKDLYNPYVVSGIMSISELLSCRSDVNVTCFEKLKEEVLNLEGKILTQLGRTSDYESAVMEEKKVDILTVKPMMAKKIYKRLLQSSNMDRECARAKSLDICSQFFQAHHNHITQEDAVQFMQSCSLTC